MTGLRAQLFNLISEHLNLPLPQLEKVKGLDELGIDSLDVIDLFSAVESHFKIRIPNETINRINSLNDLAQAVEGMVVSHA